MSSFFREILCYRIQLLAGLVLLFPSASTRADGKYFFLADQVPAGEPFQRAILVHGDGKELLVIQPQLVGEVKDFAWVLPVPAVPEMGRLESEKGKLWFLRLARRTQPRVTLVSSWVFVGLICAIGIFFLIPTPRISRKGKAIVPLCFFLPWILTGGHFTMSAGSRGSPESGVDLLRSERLGMFDVDLVRSKDPMAMKEWLVQRKFIVGKDEDSILRSYIDRGWCFAAVRISAEERGSKEGLLDGLALAFPTPDPVYPFALTAVGGGSTEVLLYVIADRKLTHPSVKLQFADLGTDLDLFMEALLFDIEDRRGNRWGSRETPSTPSASISSLPRVGKWLTKLRGSLSSKNLEGDLILQPAADQSPFREERWRW